MGCFSGYAGGSVQDYRFFLIDDSEDEVLVTDDETEFDDIYIEKIYEMQKHRAHFELYDDDEDDGSLLSLDGEKFVAEGEFQDGIKSKARSDFDLEVIYQIQDEWSLTFWID